jgi:hypothetical protein
MNPIGGLGNQAASIISLHRRNRAPKPSPAEMMQRAGQSDAAGPHVCVEAGVGVLFRATLRPARLPPCSALG